jgi:hypothetical protein
MSGEAASCCCGSVSIDMLDLRPTFEALEAKGDWSMFEHQFCASFHDLTRSIVASRKYRGTTSVSKHLPVEPPFRVKPPLKEGKPLTLDRNVTRAIRTENELSVGKGSGLPGADERHGSVH